MLTKRKLNVFSTPDFITLNIAAGVMRSRGGTRMIAVNDDFLQGFVAACEHEAGQATPIILRRCGTFFGKRLAQRFENELTSYADMPLRDRSMVEFGALLQDMFSGFGMGRIDIDWEKGPEGYLPIRLDGSPMQDIGPKGHTADDLFSGILEGFFTAFVDAPVACVQTGDKRLGSKDGTTFIVVVGDRVDDVERFVAEQLPHREIVQRLAA